jgi:hypothetical protein
MTTLMLQEGPESVDGSPAGMRMRLKIVKYLKVEQEQRFLTKSTNCLINMVRIGVFGIIII